MIISIVITENQSAGLPCASWWYVHFLCLLVRPLNTVWLEIICTYFVSQNSHSYNSSHVCQNSTRSSEYYIALTLLFKYDLNNSSCNRVLVEHTPRAPVICIMQLHDIAYAVDKLYLHTSRPWQIINFFLPIILFLNSQTFCLLFLCTHQCNAPPPPYRA